MSYPRSPLQLANVLANRRRLRQSFDLKMGGKCFQTPAQEDSDHAVCGVRWNRYE
jgi:hypothetical protein